MAVQALDIARELTAKGIERDQAEAIGDVIVRSLEDRQGDLAKASDITRLEGELRSTEQRLDSRIDQVRSELLLALERQRTQLILSIGAIVAVITAVERLLFT